MVTIDLNTNELELLHALLVEINMQHEDKMQESILIPKHLPDIDDVADKRAYNQIYPTIKRVNKKLTKILDKVGIERNKK